MTGNGAGPVGPAPPTSGHGGPGPVQVAGEIVSLTVVGAYRVAVVRVPGLPARVRPGQFVAVAVGGPATALVLRRAFALLDADPAAGTVSFVFAVRGAGTAWLAGCAAGDPLDVVGPLGVGWPVPTGPQTAVLVGGGYGSAPLFALAAAVRAAGGQAHLVLGAGGADRLFGLDRARAVATSVTVTTDDGTAGIAGRVTAPLPALLADTGASAVYACGPMPMLAAVASVATRRGLAAFVSVEEAMACGVGVCMTCVLPVVGRDGVTRMTRTCTDGPVLEATRVRFDALGTVPADCHGAAAMRGH